MSRSLNLDEDKPSLAINNLGHQIGSFGQSRFSLSLTKHTAVLHSTIHTYRHVVSYNTASMDYNPRQPDVKFYLVKDCQDKVSDGLSPSGSSDDFY